jgi:hypothetical protein
MQLPAVRLIAVVGRRSYSVGVNTTGGRPISLMSPIIRITWCGIQRSIGGAPSSRLIVNLAKTGWLKSIRAHARMSRTSLGGLPDGGFVANARNSLASCGDRSGRRRTKYRLCRTAILVLYALAYLTTRALRSSDTHSAPPNNRWRGVVMRGSLAAGARRDCAPGAPIQSCARARPLNFTVKPRHARHP